MYPSWEEHSRIVFPVYIILISGTQQKYSSKPLKHNIVERILVFER